MSAISLATLFESGYTHLLSLCGCSWGKRFRPIIRAEKRSIDSTPAQSFPNIVTRHLPRPCFANARLIPFWQPADLYQYGQDPM